MVPGTVQVKFAVVAPDAGVAQARSLGLSNTEFPLKSIHPHNVALAVNPASDTGTT
jgi:hypothetical protein